MHKPLLPSIWLAAFQDKRAFDAHGAALGASFSVMDGIDDRMIQSRHPFLFKAWCAACEAVTEMKFTWLFSGAGPDGTVNPAWTETAACEACGIGSRGRALLDLLGLLREEEPSRRVYVAEGTTDCFRVLQRMYPEVVGSEYCGPGLVSGTMVTLPGMPPVRHEDLTRLSFADGAFDLVITRDVFEHVPGWAAALRECARVLRPGGRIVFTVPFFYDQASTRVRARLNADGSIEHLLPPEIHGNPVSAEGSLCFQNFGWDLLSAMRATGFAEASANLYWGPWQGHLGFPFFVFVGRK